MAQFDVHRTRGGDLVLDCQADLLDDLNTRFVVPLQPPDNSSRVPARLNPTLTFAGEQWVLKAHFAASIATRELGEVVASLQGHRYTIQAALDTLTGSY